MKIAIVSDAIYPYNKGGKETRLFEISTRLVAMGYEVHIYTMKWWPEAVNHKLENGVHLHALSRHYPLYSGARRSITEAVMFALASFKMLVADFDLLEVDHMPHLVLYPMKLVSMVKRKKMYVVWHEVWGETYWRNYLGKAGLLAYLIEKFGAQLPDKIISVSNHTTAKLRSILKTRVEIITIPAGIDLTEIDQVETSVNETDVIYAGRLLSHKHIDILIKTISYLKLEFKEIKCLIIGEGPETKTLKRLIHTLNLARNVRIVPFFPNQSEVFSLMKASKVFVLPSTREGFGMAVLEANACGIPVITIDHPDNAAKDLVYSQNNGLVADLTISSLARSIAQLLKGRLSQDMIKKHLKNYDWLVLMDQLSGDYSHG
jgi:glycosyltransferase involved in cell wall biosynthesis